LAQESALCWGQALVRWAQGLGAQARLRLMGLGGKQVRLRVF
jgi:hypothetical protein